jgi:hypothetical protein
MPECLEDFGKMTDEELISWQKRNADLYGPQTKLIISLLTWRSAIKLKEVIEEFNITSEKYSRKIVLLTWVLVFLTVVILIFTASMVFRN